VVEKGLSDIIVGRTFCSFWAEPNPKNERTADVYVQRERVVCVGGGGGVRSVVGCISPQK
jgi:hypothetical protein